MDAPPIVRVALAYAAGAAWGTSGAPVWTAPLLAVLGLVAPIRSSSLPTRGLAVLVALAAALPARVGVRSVECAAVVDGGRVALQGRFLATPRAGSAPFRPDSGCGPLTVVTADTLAPAGVPVTVTGTARLGRGRPWIRAEDGGVRPVAADAAGPWAFGTLVRWREHLVGRLDRLYGPRARLVAALTLARREGLDPAVREAFARTGIAHLLAISGFHVGVVAGGVLTLLRLTGVSRRRSALLAALIAWLYVALIGFPDAACRAALILALVAVSRARGRPPARWGALASALMLLLVLDGRRIASPGFQLSFLGSAGLVAWARPLTEAILRGTRRRCPRPLAGALGAGVAATLWTLPAVAWHFERVSLIGIPMTLVATPLVALALPGALLSLLADPFAPGLAGFLAGGVDALLAVLEEGTGRVADTRWVSAWVSRTSVVAVAVGCGVGLALARHPRVGAGGRRGLVAIHAASALVAWPMVSGLWGWGRLELLMIDVGQGDAIAVRSARGRWVLVDAGPPNRRDPDPGAHPAVRALRAKGVDRLAALVLTHPDLDHIGGAAAVLESFDVGAVYDPALPVGSREYLDVLEIARASGVPWLAARSGDVLELDGTTLTVLSPSEPLPARLESNEASVVLHLRHGAFDALLTGDAYRPTERRIAGTVSDVEVLKVGHHGSSTSTDSILLARGGSRTALISVGRGNRYGHPAPEVLALLRRFGIEVHRTDLAGTVTVRARRDGSFTVTTEREPNTPVGAAGRRR